MKVTTRQENHVSIVDISGEMDSSALEALMIVNKLTTNSNSCIIINLEKATFIDSTGLGSLLQIYKQLRHRKIPFYVVSAQGAVKKVFDVTKMEKMLPYSSSLDEALLYLNN
ncbi:MAG: STAS domain-containing protein [Spirochaetales bacterium]|nr:STAS domain-containing protein [Spirochaetales bacterium]